MLNLPRVTGWGTDVMAGTMLRKGAEERANEEDRTRMVAQALLNQAQQGNFTEAGYGALENFGGKALADTYKQTAEQAKDDKRRQLEKMRFEKELIALKKTNEEVDLIGKFADIGDTESVKFLVSNANAKFKAMGLNVNLSPIMDAATIKIKVQEATMMKINEKIGNAEKDPTPEKIINARNTLATVGSNIKKELVPILEKRIAAAESRMQKEEERKQGLKDFEEKEKIKQKYPSKQPSKPTYRNELVVNSLRNKLKREPTEDEILKGIEESEASAAGAKAGTTEKAKFAAQEGMASPETIDQWAKYFMTTGDLPPEVGRLFRTPGAQWQAINEINKRVQKAGGTGDARAVEKAMYKAGQQSLGQQVKQRGAAGNFVRNIDKQIDRLDDYMGKLQKVSRLGVRALDLPRRELLKRVAGSGDEVVVEAYLTEISNEIGKLSTGSQASIAELSAGAQEKWANIHDPNLSINELKKILTESKEMGRMRIESMEEEIEFTKSKLQKQGQKEPQKESPKKAEWMKAAKAANPGASIKELSEYYDNKYGK